MHLIWFRHDLRTLDNLAFMGAMEAHQPCVAVYVCCPEQLEMQDEGPLRQAFHLSHVEALFKELKSMGIACIFEEVNQLADVPAAVESIVQAHKVTHCWFNNQYGFWEADRDEQVKTRLSAMNVGVTTYDDEVILPPAAVSKNDGGAYKVFTPFKKAWMAIDKETSNRDFPYKPEGHSAEITKIATNKAIDTAGARAAHFREEGSQQFKLWPIGAKAAQERLAEFLDVQVKYYAEERDLPAKKGTSSLSPYLASGVISPRDVFRQVKALPASEGRDVWISELVWRDFYRHLMVHFPHVAKGYCFNREYEEMTWTHSEKRLKAWTEGKTGIPLVDAGIRQLIETGWMHNRVRMVVAMFLTKNLFMSWREGERFFMQHLVDGDYASNNGGWQWSASVGTDAAPYFRVFNPVTQAERFDPECEYILRYVPELKGADKKWILKADKYQKELTKHGYSSMIVDLKKSRQEAIDRFKQFKS